MKCNCGVTTPHHRRHTRRNTSVSNAARCCFDQLCLSRTKVEMICHRYMAHIIDAIHINVTFFQNYGRRCEGPCWQRLGNCSCAVEQGNSLRQTAKPWMVPEQVGLLQYGLPLLSAWRSCAAQNWDANCAHWYVTLFDAINFDHSSRICSSSSSSSVTRAFDLLRYGFVCNIDEHT